MQFTKDLIDASSLQSSPENSSSADINSAQPDYSVTLERDDLMDPFKETCESY